MSLSGGNDNRLKRDPDDEVWSNWQGAVLIDKDIEHYSSLDPPLIKDLRKESCKPAGYHLRLGSCCRVQGQDKNLSKSDPSLEIPPFAVAVLSTLEEVNIPGFLIARWNLRVKRVYSGLIWTGSLQVDPGYSGHLFCPVFNLSTKTVVLEYEEELFTIDFVKTTGYGGLIELDRDTHSIRALGALDKTKLRSGVADIDDRISKIEEKVNQFLGNILTVIVILVTAIAVIASVQWFGGFDPNPNMNWPTFALSILAFLLALSVFLWAQVFHYQSIKAWWKSRRKNPN